jgi:membrane protein DedA with SNARE-associated domain
VRLRVFESLVADPNAYLAVFFMCTMAGLLIPVPEDLPLLYTGARIHQGEMEYAPALIAVLLGVAIRDALAYGLGRFVGDKILTRPGALRIFGAARLARTRRLVDRFGGRAVLLGRFMVGLRAPLFAVSGAMGMPAARFFAWNFAGLVVAVPLVVVLGDVIGQPLIDAGNWFVERWRIAGPVLLVSLVVWFAWVRLRPSPATEHE